MDKFTLIGVSLSIILNTIAARSYEPTWKELTFKNKAIIVFIWIMTMKLFWYVPYKILTSRNTFTIIKFVSALMLIYFSIKLFMLT
jgi:hypothetical protein